MDGGREGEGYVYGRLDSACMHITKITCYIKAICVPQAETRQ
jgi:hypothetical protein